MYENVQIKTEAAMEQARAVDKINQLTQAILEISSQTNLLALNASIEAARAGEAGRGFAVVADEIGQLASQTSSTAGNINGIISEVNEAVGNMSNCLKESMDFLEGTVLKDYDNFMQVAEQYTEDAAGFENGMTVINSEVQTLLDSIVDIADAVDGVSTTVAEAAEEVTNVAQKTQDVAGVVEGNAISLGDGARITLKDGSKISDNVTQNVKEGNYKTGYNTIEFNSNGILTIEEGAEVSRTGSDNPFNNAEAINVHGDGKLDQELRYCQCRIGRSNLVSK